MLGDVGLGNAVQGIVAGRGASGLGQAGRGAAGQGKATHSSPAWRSAAVLGVAWPGMVRRCEAR